MSSSLSRRFKRKASRKMSYEEIKERMEKSTDTTVGLFMAIPVDVLFEDYGWTPKGNDTEDCVGRPCSVQD